MELPVGVEKRDIDPSPRSLANIDLDDLELRLTGPEEGTEALEDDHVVVDERNPDRLRHGFTLRLKASARAFRITRSGD
ncbi:MAG: hypothetical protein ACLPYY_09725 [Acidimicrobiales bacterium]